MTKRELISALGETRIPRRQTRRGQLSAKHSERVIDAFFALVLIEVQRVGRVRWPGFGTWSLRGRKARVLTNPATQEPMTIPASLTIHFRPDKAAREKL